MQSRSSKEDYKTLNDSVIILFIIFILKPMAIQAISLVEKGAINPQIALS